MMYGVANFMLLLDISSMEVESITLPIPHDFWQGFDWSPQGDRFAFVTDVSSIWTLWTYSTDDEAAQVVISDSTVLLSPRWAADGENLYYLRSGGLEWELWKVQISLRTGKREGNPHRIQGGLQDPTQLSISKDNTRLLYHNPNTHNNLWSITIDEVEGKTSWEKLTEGTASVDNPRISPDGQHIAFIRQNALGSDVYTMPLSGGESQQHTFIGGLNSELSWSSEGQRLAFGAKDDGMTVVMVLDTKSERTSSFKSDRFGEGKQLTWGPGERILYQRSDNRNFYMFNPETGEERPLVTNDSVGWMFNPRYSPDGKTVAVMWNRQKERLPGIWTISLTDSTQTLVAQVEGDIMYPLQWSSDGKWIYATAMFQYPQSILKLAIDGSERHEIATLPYTGIFGIDVSSDGKYIVVALPESQSDIWMLENFDPDVPAK